MNTGTAAARMCSNSSTRQVSTAKCMVPAKKLISATNFVLKGLGFYVNDYPSRSRNDGKRAEIEGSNKAAPLKGEKKSGEKTS